MTDEIINKIWALSPVVEISDSYQELLQLTDELIKVYDLQNRIAHDPFDSTRERTVSLPFDKINYELKGSTCIVTGGYGCVGSALVHELLKFEVKTVIILDSKNNAEFPASAKVNSITCDVRDMERVLEVFSVYQPHFVFHTAAQRDPGFAENNIEETVRVNVIGTLNMVKACEATGSVKQMIFSSTGKASRYFTEEVYAGTKKVCEFILDTYARESVVRYSMARFTHILDNSLMNAELKNASDNDSYVAVHSPGKYVTAQNANEAAYLMLNALVYSTMKQCNILLIRYLEWPVESLEMALFHIKKSGRHIPVAFVGNPIGYCEKFFRGQMDWSKPEDLNLLINVYEQKYRQLNADEDIIISRVCPTQRTTLDKVVDIIGQTKGETQMKTVLVDGLKELVKDSLKMVNNAETINILRWGLDPGFLEMENKRENDFDILVPLLKESLAEQVIKNRKLEELIYTAV